MKEKKELKNNTIVTTIMSNMGLYKALEKKNITYVKTNVGDKYVSENMMLNGYCLGGEDSGHIIFYKHAVTGDGILTSLKIMEVMLEKKIKASELIKGLKNYPQLLKNVRVKDKKIAIEDADVVSVANSVEEILGSEGRLLLRESGTEPVIRVMVEAKTDEICEEMVNKVIQVLISKGHTIS